MIIIIVLVIIVELTFLSLIKPVVINQPRSVWYIHHILLPSPSHHITHHILHITPSHYYTPSHITHHLSLHITYYHHHILHHHILHHHYYHHHPTSHHHYSLLSPSLLSLLSPSLLSPSPLSPSQLSPSLLSPSLLSQGKFQEAARLYKSAGQSQKVPTNPVSQWLLLAAADADVTVGSGHVYWTETVWSRSWVHALQRPGTHEDTNGAASRLG